MRRKLEIVLAFLVILILAGCRPASQAGREKDTAKENAQAAQPEEDGKKEEAAVSETERKEETSGMEEGTEEAEVSVRTIYLAGGCFWGSQKFFDQFSGVISTEVGYANGSMENPSYQEVCHGSGHAETVKIEYDENKISTQKLLEYYFMTIDPTSVNHQGGDWGEQYRTGIYYEDEDLLPAIQEAYDAEKEAIGKELAVEVMPLQNFYSAETYHQKYLDKNPGGYCHIPEKLFHLEKAED